MPKSPSTPKRKKTTKKKPKNSNITKMISYIILVVLLLLVTLGLGYYFGYEDGSEDTMARYEQKIQKSQKVITHLKNANSCANKSATELKSELQRVLNKQKTSAHEYAQKEPPAPAPRPPVKVKKPKLAIIIDDVSFARDIKNIKSVGIPLTMSFLPPTPTHPNSAKLAAKEPYYMVHLPMEAMNFHSPEPLTLHVNDSKRQIQERIRKVKKLFPRVEYINNHTGSRFTSSRIAMMRLIDVLNHEGIKFIDSRTTAQTKAPEVMKYYHKPYIARDVFLDHDGKLESVKYQIKRAVERAKKYGKAIAIGHPHKNTLEALKESKALLNQVDLVRIDHY